jgi:hydrogenase maturation protease
MNTFLVIGYGNPDRQDDGIAWHVLNRLSGLLGQTTDFDSEIPYDFLDQDTSLLYVLQLTPELAETIHQYKEVFFIDAHTGNLPEEIRIIEVNKTYEASPLSHHMTPASCLALCESVYHSSPNSLLISIRGYEFGFSHDLTPKADILVNRVVNWLLTRIKE